MKSLALFWPELAADPTAWEVSLPSPFVLQALDTAIDDELRRHGSAAVDRVFSSVCAVAPVGTDDPTLSGPDRQSAVRIRESLEGLSATGTLLHAYARLSVPDPRLAGAGPPSLLRSADALMDGHELCGAFAAGENPLRLVWLEEEPRQRVAGFSEALRVALEDASASGAGALHLVEATLQQVEAAIRVQRLRTVTARAAR